MGRKKTSEALLDEAKEVLKNAGQGGANSSQFLFVVWALVVIAKALIRISDAIYASGSRE